LARIRTIKPEFWTNERVMECSANARLLFIGMWNFADDLGRLAFAPKTIKAQIFPSDDIGLDAVRGMVYELSKNGLLLVYEAAGKEYLQIVGWQHQRIDKPQPGKCPAPTKGYSKSDPGMVATDSILPEGKVPDPIPSDIMVDARATASSFTEGSKSLATALWKALGHETALNIPPELAGADWRAIEWERAGWTADLVETEARRVGPGKPLSYYEKVFATSFAKRQAPLPVVEIKEAETLTVTHGRRSEVSRQSLPDAARRLAEAGISFGPRPELPTLRSVAGGADVRLLPQSGGDGPGDLCGGSGGGIERLSASGD
jgi:hypothetical protein